MVWVVGIGLFVLALLAFPKQVGIFLLIVGALIGGAILYYQNQESERVRELAAIRISVAYDLATCTSTHPIAMSISNGTRRTILELNINLSAKRPGYSDDVYTDYVRSTRILAPSTIYSACWQLDTSSYSLRVPNDPATLGSLNWSGSIVTSRFQ
jgi:hypothetical protein